MASRSKSAERWGFFERTLLLADGLAAACAAALALVSVFEVTARYVFATSHPWADDVERILLVNLVFLAAASAYRHDVHPRVEFALELAPAPVRRALLALADAIGLSICVMFTWLSGSYVASIYAAKIASTSSVATPVWIIAAALPIGFALLSAAIAQHLVRLLLGDERADPVASRRAEGAA